jgi:hypothetical protein
MGRLDPKYSSEQKQAIVHAIVDQGMTARRATELAAQGALEKGLAPFKMPISTAHSFTRRAKHSWQAMSDRGDFHRAILHTAETQLSLLKWQVELIQKRQEESDGELEKDDISKLRLIGGSLRELGKLVEETRRGQRLRAPQRVEPESNPADEAVLEGMLEKLKAAENGSARDNGSS